MKKSLLISEIFPPKNGGSGRWFWELYSRLPKNNYIIAAGYTKGDQAFDQGHNLNLHRLNLSSNSWGIRSLTGLTFYWRVFNQIRKLVKQHKITSIHCGRCLPEGVIGYLLHKLLALPYLCYIHGEDLEAAATSRALTWLVIKGLNNANRLICNSQNTADLILNNWQVPAAKVEILNPGVDAERFIPAEKNVDIKNALGWQDRPVILTVGRLQKRKGQDMLIKALVTIKQDIPNVLYVIIGDGDEKSALKKLTQKLQLQDNVLFMNEISDEQMIQAYQQCDVFTLANRTVGQDIEGFGMVLVEAQACAKPVIAGDSGGTAETMIIGETGFIIDCNQPKTLSHTLLALLNDPQKRHLMGQKARVHAAATLDWKIHKIKAETIFSQI